MKIILCSSPFHIITAINMKEKLYRDAPVAVILTDFSTASKVYYNIMCQDKRFEKVFYVPSKKIIKKFEKGNMLYRLFYFLRADSHLKKYGINPEEVDELIYPYRDQIVKAIAKCARTKGKKIIFSHYEDGVGSYIGGATAETPSRMELALGIPIRFYIPDNIYMYTPQLCNNYCDLKIKQLPFISNLNMYNEYQDNDNTCHKIKAIFLDSYPYDEADMLSEWSNKIMVKKHPKRNDNIYEDAGFSHIWTATQPFELSMMNDEQLENRVFISVCSTAGMSPKRLFNKEPIVIFLKKLTRDENLKQNEEYEQLIYRFRDIYTDKSRVYIPDTIDEFKNIMNTVL